MRSLYGITFASGFCLLVNSRLKLGDRPEKTPGAVQRYVWLKVGPKYSTICYERGPFNAVISLNWGLFGPRITVGLPLPATKRWREKCAHWANGKFQFLSPGNG